MAGRLALLTAVMGFDIGTADASRSGPSSILQQAAAVANDRAAGHMQFPRLAQSGNQQSNRRTPSEFILRNPELFKDDPAPWPKTGSEEWKRQQERDREREEKLKKSIQICRDC